MKEKLVLKKFYIQAYIGPSKTTIEKKPVVGLKVFNLDYQTEFLACMKFYQRSSRAGIFHGILRAHFLFSLSDFLLPLLILMTYS